MPLSVSALVSEARRRMGRPQPVIASHNEAVLAGLPKLRAKRTLDNTLAHALLAFHVADKKDKNTSSSLAQRVLALTEEHEKEHEEHHDDPITEHPVPVTTAIKIKHGLGHGEQSEQGHGDIVRIRGNAMLGMLATGSPAPPSGSCVFSWPLTPALFGDSRLTTLAQTFDLYKWHFCVVEWVPICPTSTAGAIIGFCSPDVMTDSTVLDSGNVMLRDAMSRQGSETNSVIERCAYNISLPQQQVYYTADTDVPNLMTAGTFQMVSVGSLAPNTTFGILYIHYDIEFSSPTSERVASTDVTTYGTTVLAFNGNALTTNQAFFNGSAQFGSIGTYLVRGMIGCCTVVTVTDVTTPITWRTLRYGEGTANLSINVGTKLWFRVDVANNNVIYYPSFGAAINGANPSAANQYSDTFYNTATNTPVAGTSLTVDFIQIWTLPNN